jgi:hypothetical protein
MNDFILQTDPLEFQNSRQSTKLIFLQQEIKQLQDHIQDLEQIIRINKEALKITTSAQSNQKKKSIVPTDFSSTTLETSPSKDTKNLQLLVKELQEENMKLLEIIEKVKKERNIAQSKVIFIYLS